VTLKSLWHREINSARENGGVISRHMARNWRNGNMRRNPQAVSLALSNAAKRIARKTSLVRGRGRAASSGEINLPGNHLPLSRQSMS